MRTASFTFIVVLQSLLQAQDSKVEAPPLPAPTPSDARTLRLAIVQMQSLDHNTDQNLTRASTFADAAAAKGAQLVLFPELMPTGSYLSFDTWDAAAPSRGKTVQWPKSTSRRLHIWLGTSFLEAEGEDFYDTFFLTTPAGDEAGRVRKQIPAGPEAYALASAPRTTTASPPRRCSSSPPISSSCRMHRLT